MRSIRFNTRISKSGNIQVPFDNSLYDKEVEVTIKHRIKKRRKELSATDFVNKWAGFLNSDNPDKSKYDYLSEKYK
jgi:hypothetical protein